MFRYFQVSLLLFFHLAANHSLAQPFYIDAQTASYIKDAAYSPKHNYVFFFNGSSVMLYNEASTQPVKPAWYQLGDFGQINAAVLWDEDYLLLFVGPYYSLYDIDSARIISNWVLWPNLPEEWKGKVDAAVRWSNNEIMFFSGNEYLLYDIPKNEYTVKDNFTKWDGWPSNWNKGLQAVLNIHNTIYFLENNEFISLDPGTHKFSTPSPVWKTR